MRSRQKGRYSENSDGIKTQSQEDLKTHKMLQLPKIKKKKYVFMDDVSISEDYIKISEEKVQPFMVGTSQKHHKSDLKMGRKEKESIYMKMALEDRIWQKQEEQDKKYANIMSYVKRKSAEKHKKIEK